MNKPSTAPYSKSYFSWITVILLVLALIAFSDNLIYDIGQESNSDPKFVIHGLFFLAWFIILVVQTNLIRKGDIRAHRKWGMIGMGIGLGVVVSTFYVFYAVYEGWEAMEGFVRANRIFTLSFTIMLAWAYWKRNKPDLHKRLLMVGTWLTLGPVVDRVAGKLGGESDWYYLLFEVIIWNGLFISLILFDRKTLGKVHPVTWIGFLWFYVVWMYSWLV
ncbi:hypothetical protein [Algoriphagus sp. AK58]|uniref:hypothetical protein n=1 Tax=Algoriphagus sp. AK58 TaxID=1406877 RepID=UPI00165044FA|nr:hypothetical protein [Algoriphagus sp. AK58]MBC6365846.1 hypothetical protein [Algoriphagus sp. AK58]